jgi:RNA polymerase sigma-70 factor (ECF subfamily)
MTVPNTAGLMIERDGPLARGASASIERTLVRFREVALKAGTAHGLNASEIDEVMQDVRIRLWRAGESGGAAKVETLTSSYIYRAAASAALDMLRRRRARREHLTDEVLPSVQSPGSSIPAPDQAVLGHDTLAAVADALGALMPNRRAAVRMHLAGYDRDEIAALLRWSEAKTRNLIYRGLDDLRQLLLARGVGPEGAR